MKQSPPRITYIDELFDVDSITGGGDDYIAKGNADRDQFTQQLNGRHIRSFDRENPYEINSGMRIQQPSQTQTQLPPPDFRFMPNLPSQVPYYQHFEHVRQSDELSCMTIANHIKECPICSKFYNCDNSMYIVCIVLLIIVCIILLKRIIEKN
jgi:hypothetical protein